MEEGRSESVSYRGETSEGVVTSANNPPLSNLPVGRAPSSGWPSAENMESTPIQYTQYNPLPNHPRFASRYAFLPPVPAFVERNYRGPHSRHESDPVPNPSIVCARARYLCSKGVGDFAGLFDFSPLPFFLVFVETKKERGIAEDGFVRVNPHGGRIEGR